MKELKQLILDTDEEIKKLDETDPKYKQNYLEQYMDARRESGFDDTMVQNSDTFMKYLGDDINLEEVLQNNN